jgi:hypothetical protein
MEWLLLFGLVPVFVWLFLRWRTLRTTYDVYKYIRQAQKKWKCYTMDMKLYPAPCGDEE